MFHSPQSVIFNNSDYIQSVFEESITTHPPYRPDLMTPPPYIPNLISPFSPRRLEHMSDFILNIHEQDSAIEIERTVALMLDFDNYTEKKKFITQKITLCNEEFECTICLNSSTCGGKLKC